MNVHEAIHTWWGRCFLFYPAVFFVGAVISFIINLPIMITLLTVFPPEEVGDAAVKTLSAADIIAFAIVSVFFGYIGHKFSSNWGYAVMLWTWIGFFWGGLGAASLLASKWVRDHTSEDLQEKATERQNRKAHIMTVVGAVLWGIWGMLAITLLATS